MSFFRRIGNWLYLFKIYLFGNNKFGNLRVFNCQVKITNNCNSRCISCNIWKNKKKDHIDYQAYVVAIGKLKRYGLKSVGLTGGEPLLHEKIVEICKSTKEMGINVSLSTNGLLLSKKYKEIINWVDEINVSIDGLEKMNDMVRGVDGYYRLVMKTIEKIRREYPDKKILISSTINYLSLEEIEKLLKVCLKNNFQWSFNLLCNTLYFFKGIEVKKNCFSRVELKKIKKLIYKYKKKGIVRFSNQAIDYAIEYLDNKKRQQRCLLGLTSVFLDTKLNWYTGCWAMAPVGNLLDSTVEEIVDTNRFRKRIKNMVDLKCPGCTCGFDENIDVNSLPRTFFEKILTKFNL